MSQNLLREICLDTIDGLRHLEYYLDGYKACCGEVGGGGQGRNVGFIAIPIIVVIGWATKRTSITLY